MLPQSLSVPSNWYTKLYDTSLSIPINEWQLRKVVWV